MIAPVYAGAEAVPPVAPVLPDDEAVRSMLLRMRVPASAVDEVLGARPAPGTAAWDRLEAKHRELVTRSKPLCWGPTPTDATPVDRWLALWTFVAAVPHHLALDAARGVPEDVTWLTLGDIGDNIASRISLEGRAGFDAFWFSYHLRGRIYRLGRLQFNVGRATIDSGPDAPFVPGDPVLGVHIPMAGPLTPAACDDAFGRARDFFPRHVSDRHVPVGTCRSWLLDPVLAEYLPEDSNIVRFQRRFRLVADWSLPGDDAILHYVYGRPHADPATLEPRSILQEAIRDRLRAGDHFLVRRGWLRL